MKKYLFTVCLLITSLMIFSCGKKQTQEVQPEENVEVVNRDYVNPELNETQAVQNNTPSVAQDQLNDLDLDNLQIQVVEEAVDYNEFTFEKVTNVIFSISNVRDVTQTSDDTTMLLTEITGSISGVPGTFKLVAPYSDKWVRGDKAFVSYEVCFPDETNTYIRNIHIDSKYSSEYIKELERQEAELQAQIKAQEEEEQKKIEESKKQEEAKRMAEIRRQNQLAEQAALQAELARLEQEAKNPPIVPGEGTNSPILIPGNVSR